MHPVFQSSRRDFTFGPWKLSAARTHIMKSAQAERTLQSSEIIGGNVPVSASST